MLDSEIGVVVAAAIAVAIAVAVVAVVPVSAVSVAVAIAVVAVAVAIVAIAVVAVAIAIVAIAVVGVVCSWSVRFLFTLDHMVSSTHFQHYYLGYPWLHPGYCSGCQPGWRYFHSVDRPVLPDQAGQAGQAG